MLLDTNLISNRKFKIRNFEEDKIATLEANPGLRYEGKIDGIHKFCGNFYLTNSEGELIESFGIVICLSKKYPNCFPFLLSTDDKIDKIDDYHISKDGIICVEHTYVAMNLASASLRLFDFISYYLPRYFSWVLLKQKGLSENLEEWAHQDKGTIQVYETLLNTTDKSVIKQFLEGFLSVKKIGRNNKCYCGSRRNLKDCHYESAHFLKAIPRDTIKEDIALFK